MRRTFFILLIARDSFCHATRLSFVFRCFDTLVVDSHTPGSNSRWNVVTDFEWISAGNRARHSHSVLLECNRGDDTMIASSSRAFDNCEAA